MKMLLQWIHTASQNLNSLIWCLNLLVLKSNHPGFAIPIMRFSRLYLQRQRGGKQRGGEGRRKGRGKGREKGEGGQADCFYVLFVPVLASDHSSLQQPLLALHPVKFSISHHMLPLLLRMLFMIINDN